MNHTNIVNDRWDIFRSLDSANRTKIQSYIPPSTNNVVTSNNDTFVSNDTFVNVTRNTNVTNGNTLIASRDKIDTSKINTIQSEIIPSRTIPLRTIQLRTIQSRNDTITNNTVAWENRNIVTSNENRAQLSFFNTLNNPDNKTNTGYATTNNNTNDTMFKYPTNGTTNNADSWRPENQGALVPRGKRDDASLANQLLYAATHVNESQRRHLSNLIAKERLYRRMFCGHVTTNRDDGLNESLVNGDMSFIKYRDEERELTLETLCEHIEAIIGAGYSLTYTFAYLSYLRRKYRGSYPKLRGQTSEFYRILIDNYERERKTRKRIGTDEVYTCEERIYEKMYELARQFFFDNSQTTETSIAATTTTNGENVDEETTNNETNANGNRLLFTYAFMFMFITGKRLSEIALIGYEQLGTLLRYEALVIRIPKAKKLGRIVMRDYDDDVRKEFKTFLERCLVVFEPKSLHGKEIPFNQFEKRRTLDRAFARLYNETTRRLNLTDERKPRGLSLHSLRRFRAATLFAQGKTIDHIRECLDHNSTKVTNMYINKHLMRSYRTDTSVKSNGQHGTKDTGRK